MTITVQPDHTFTVQRAGTSVTVTIVGKLVVATRQELKHKVLDELETKARHFTLDFSRAGDIDASGLGVLVSLSKKIREAGGDLNLRHLNNDLKTLFELTKLDTLFRIDGEEPVSWTEKWARLKERERERLFGARPELVK